MRERREIERAFEELETHLRLTAASARELIAWIESVERKLEQVKTPVLKYLEEKP